MKIAVNTRLLLKDRLEGIGWFTYETLKRITTSHPEHQFYFFFDRKYDDSFIFSGNIIPIVLSPPTRHPLLYYIWFEWSVNNKLQEIKPDLFLSPDGCIPLRSNIASLSVIHDLNFEHYPYQLPWTYRNYYRYFFPKFSIKATRIATVSAYSKHDISNKYNIPDDKIDVVYNGANELYKPISTLEIANCRKTYTGGCPYFIFIGSLNPRKNIANLLLAFDLFKKQCTGNEKLLLIGGKKWWPAECEHIYKNMSFKEDVIFMPYCAPGELMTLIPSALAMTYVSFFEGFGIPIIEAMQSGVPVITSNTSSMPEIAGDAALVINPDSIEEIATAMNKVQSDSELRSELIKKGLARSSSFNWEKTASRLWDSIEKTLIKC